MSSIFKELTHLAKHSAIYGLSNILGKAIGFLLIPLYTHYISPDDYGVLELLDLTITMIGMFVGMGLASAVAKFYFDFNEKSARDLVVSTALTVLVIAAAGLTVLVWQFAPLLANLVLGNANYAVYVKISLATFACNAILEIPLTYIRAREKSVFFGAISICRLLMALSLNIFFIVVLQRGILGILYSGLITSLLFGIGLVLWILRDVGIKVSIPLAWSMILFGTPLIINNLGMFVINFGDRFLLKTSASLSDVGVYSLGYKIGMGLVSFLIGQPFFLIWSVRRYKLVKERHGLDRYGQVFLLYMLLLLFVCLAITAFSREMITLLAPSEYQAAWEIMPIIAFAYLFREMSDFFRGAFMICSKTRWIGILTTIVTIFCVLNYLVLIPRFHSVGAAIATLLTFIFMAMLNGYYAQKIMPVNYRFRKILILLALYSAMGGWCIMISMQGVSITAACAKATIVVVTAILTMFMLFNRVERGVLLVKARNLLQKTRMAVFDGP